MVTENKHTSTKIIFSTGINFFPLLEEKKGSTLSFPEQMWPNYLILGPLMVLGPFPGEWVLCIFNVPLGL